MVQTDETTRIIPVCTFQAHTNYLTRVLLSPDVKHLATCSADHTAKVWNLDADYGPAKVALKQWKEQEALKPPVETPTEEPVAPAFQPEERHPARENKCEEDILICAIPCYPENQRQAVNS